MTPDEPTVTEGACIVAMWQEGWSVDGIAAQLNIPRPYVMAVLEDYEAELIDTRPKMPVTAEQHARLRGFTP